MVSDDTSHGSVRPSDSLAESTYLTPASPCAAQVPAISSTPLPMMVLHTISVGLPLSDSLAERAGGRLHTGGPAELGVAGGLRVLDTEVLDLLHGQIVARHVQPRVEEHRAV